MRESRSENIDSQIGFLTLFENATLAIVVVGGDGKILMANPATEKMFGYDSTELNGEAIEVLIPISHRQKHLEYRKGYHENPHPRPMGNGMDLNALRKNGTEFPVEISLAAYTIGDQNFSVAFINDITKRKQSEITEKLHKLELERKIKEHTRELAESLQREKQLNVLKSRFVSMASHEFRTPLSAILTSISLIDSYIERNEPEKAEKHIKRIKSSVSNLTQILNDFLSIDKIEQGKIEANPENTEIDSLLRSICEEMNDNLKPGQHIKYCHNGNKEMISDPNLTRNILVNLISNASKYSFDCCPIDIESSINNGLLQIQVTDHGIGIPEADKSKLFGMFFRATNVGEINGTGLGLNIVSKYVSLLDGNITFTSLEGQGTTFFVTIPSQSVL